MSGKPQRPGVAPPRLIGGLAVAALLAFALSLAIGPSGFGSFFLLATFIR